MKKKKIMKRLFCILLIGCMILSTSIQTFAASQYQDVITQREDEAEEIVLDNYSTKEYFNPADNVPATRALVVISNISRPVRYNLFTPVSNYVASPGTVSVSRGHQTTVNAQVTGGGGVSLEVLQAQISASLGVAVTFTTTQTISYQVSQGYKGRIVLRYSQDYYTYTVTMNGRGYNGSAYTAAYDEYYALQQVSLT